MSTPGEQISLLTALASAPTGTELAPVSQNNGAGFTTYKATLAQLGGITPATSAESAASSAPSALQYLPFDARRSGAAANASADDSGYLNNAVKVAQEGFYDIPMVSYLTGGGYAIANTVSVSYLTQGQVNYKGAKIHGPTIVYPTMSNYVFQIQLDAYGQQEAVYKIEDMVVVGDGAHHPSFMRTSYLYFSECNSVHSFSGGPVIDWQFGGQNISRGCTAFGGTGAVGFNVYRCHDSYTTEFHAYACATGVQAQGVNNTGSDGNVNFVNGVSHGNSAYGFFVKGLYTPTLVNIVAEVQPVNVHIESCQYGLTWGAFLGPTNASPNYSLHYAYNSGNGNTFNIVGAINAQNEMQFEQMQSSVIADSIVAGIPSSNSGGAISLTNASALLIFNGMMVRNNPGYYSFVQDSTCNSNIINGGRYEQQIYLKGTKSGRTNNVICPNYAPSIKTDDAVQGQFALSEYVRFFDGSRINETSLGYLLPYTAQTGTLAAASNISFDVTTIVPAGSQSINMSTATFSVCGGASGSTTAATVQVMRSLDATLLTILSNIGGRGSLVVSVSGNDIVCTNASGSVTSPYKITLVALANY